VKEARDMPPPLDNLLAFYISTQVTGMLSKNVLLQQGSEVNLLHHRYCITKGLIRFAADGR
jgi:hypothetical protein